MKRWNFIDEGEVLCEKCVSLRFATRSRDDVRMIGNDLDLMQLCARAVIFAAGGQGK